jgi:hypothetical protein
VTGDGASDGGELSVEPKLHGGAQAANVVLEEYQRRIQLQGEGALHEVAKQGKSRPRVII